MYLTILNFTDYRKQIAELNGIITRTQLTDLLRIYTQFDKQKTIVTDTRIQAFRQLIDYNLEKKRPLLPKISDYSKQKINITIKALRFDAVKRSKTLNELNKLIATNELGDYLQIEDESNPVITKDAIIVIKMDYTKDYDEYDNIYQVIKLAKNYKTVGYLQDIEWVNISASNIFKGDLTNEEAAVANVMKKYFIGDSKNKTLFSNFKLSDFCNGINVNMSAALIDSKYYRVNLAYTLTESSLPESLSKKLDGCYIDAIVHRNFIKGYDAPELPNYYDIVWIIESKNSSSSWTSKFALANKMYEGSLELRTCIPWPDNAIESIIFGMKRVIARVDHVWVAAGKGVGKSTLSDSLDDTWMIIDSDTKGKMLYKIIHDESLQKDCLDKNYTSPGLVSTLYDVVFNGDDVPSIYEIMAEKYCTENAITPEVILMNKINSYYNNFIPIYNNVSKFLSSDKNGWFKMCGCVLPFYNLRHSMGPDNTGKKLKVLQFVHNANELYGAMSDAIYYIESTINTTPIHLRRLRGSIVTQMF